MSKHEWDSQSGSSRKRVFQAKIWECKGLEMEISWNVGETAEILWDSGAWAWVEWQEAGGGWDPCLDLGFTAQPVNVAPWTPWVGTGGQLQGFSEGKELGGSLKMFVIQTSIKYWVKMEKKPCLFVSVLRVTQLYFMSSNTKQSLEIQWNFFFFVSLKHPGSLVPAPHRLSCSLEMFFHLWLPGMGLLKEISFESLLLVWHAHGNLVTAVGISYKH